VAKAGASVSVRRAGVTNRVLKVVSTIATGNAPIARGGA
jgi:hypothetical protein